MCGGSCLRFEIQRCDLNSALRLVSDIRVVN
jgi:hypothetical protein